MDTSDPILKAPPSAPAESAHGAVKGGSQHVPSPAAPPVFEWSWKGRRVPGDPKLWRSIPGEQMEGTRLLSETNKKNTKIHFKDVHYRYLIQYQGCHIEKPHPHRTHVPARIPQKFRCSRPSLESSDPVTSSASRPAHGSRRSLRPSRALRRP